MRIFSPICTFSTQVLLITEEIIQLLVTEQEEAIEGTLIISVSQQLDLEVILFDVMRLVFEYVSYFDSLFFFTGNFYQNDRSYQGRRNTKWENDKRDNFAEPLSNNRGTFGQFSNDNRRGGMGSGNRSAFFNSKPQQRPERSRPPYEDFPENTSSSCTYKKLF